MIIIDYDKRKHKEIIKACVHALRDGKIVGYPTETSYGLAVDATNVTALKRLYKVKSRGFDQPTHVIAPSVAYAKKLVVWNSAATKLAKAFWPGSLTLVLPLAVKEKWAKLLSADSGTLGIRMPDYSIPNDLAKILGVPITALSANPSGKVHGGVDSYTAQQIYDQFENLEYKPDILINVGKLKGKKPSTLVKIVGSEVEILRKGPVSEKEIKRVLN